MDRLPLPINICSFKIYQMAPSFARPIQVVYTFSKNIHSLISKPISKLLLIFQKNYLKSTNIYSTFNAPTRNFKIHFVPPSIKYRYSISTLIILYKKKYCKEFKRRKYSIKNKSGPYSVHAHLPSTK